MKKILYYGRGTLRSIRAACVSLQINTHLYNRKTDLPDFSWEKLEERWQYHDPHCYVLPEENHRQPVFLDLSIIIPLYNSAAYLLKLAKMLSAQKTNYSFEVIMINDGSKDNTESILHELAAKHGFIVPITQENGGISKARNTGIKIARGKFISFIDHDDEITENFVQRLLETALSSNADLVKCWYGQKYDSEVVATGMSTGFVWAGVYSRNIFEFVRFPEGYWYEDMINNFVLRPQANHIMEINDVLYYKNSTRNNASKKIWKSANYKCIEHIYLVRSLISCYRKLGLTDKRYLFERVLRECSSLAVNRTADLDEETRKLVFLACNDLVSDVLDEQDGSGLTKKDKVFYEAIVGKDYSKWLLAARL